MSSFVSHSITGAAIAFHDRQPFTRPLLWSCWLIVLACFPDSEYGVLWLFGINFFIRFTHSVVFCSLLPACTLFYLLRYTPRQGRTERIIQVFGAAYSHLVLDLLVGVYPLPLLWPFTNAGMTLPFGVLPSAGRLVLTNYYLYRNLFIELGILLPLYSFLLFRRTIWEHRLRIWLLGGHLLIWLPCLAWGLLLER